MISVSSDDEEVQGGGGGGGITMGDNGVRKGSDESASSVLESQNKDKLILTLQLYVECRAHLRLELFMKFFEDLETDNDILCQKLSDVDTGSDVGTSREQFHRKPK